MKITETIKFWFENARYHALTQSAWAALVAITVALTKYTPYFSFKCALVALLGVLFAHLSVNLLDDYFDYKSGSVEKRNALNSPVRAGKCAYLTGGKATPAQLFVCAAVFGLIALAAGWYLFLYRGFPVIILTVIALILGFFYSAPPLRLSYNGLGELVVGLMFGPLLMNGVFFCATGTVSLQLLLLSFALGALIINILYVHSIMDTEADIASGKSTLAVILPNKGLKLAALIFFALYPYWIVTVGVWRYNMPKLALAMYLTLPLTIVLIKFMIEFLNGDKKQHEWRVWMGQMERWEQIKSIGIDWFMIRWYIARNIVVCFSFIVSLAYCVQLLSEII